MKRHYRVIFVFLFLFILIASFLNPSTGEFYYFARLQAPPNSKLSAARVANWGIISVFKYKSSYKQNNKSIENSKKYLSFLGSYYLLTPKTTPKKAYTIYQVWNSMENNAQRNCIMFYKEFKEDLGLNENYEEFRNAMENESASKAFHSTFKNDLKLPDYYTFCASLGLKPDNE